MLRLTRFEVTRLISARALQLSLGAPALAKAPKGVNALGVAKIELEKKIIPISVLREFPDGHVEKIEVK